MLVVDKSTGTVLGCCVASSKGERVCVHCSVDSQMPLRNTQAGFRDLGIVEREVSNETMFNANQLPIKVLVDLPRHSRNVPQTQFIKEALEVSLCIALQTTHKASSQPGSPPGRKELCANRMPIHI